MGKHGEACWQHYFAPYMSKSQLSHAATTTTTTHGLMKNKPFKASRNITKLKVYPIFYVEQTI